MKKFLKFVYKATIGKKTVVGGILIIVGTGLGGPFGLGMVTVGKIVLTIGLGDKAVRTVIKKVKK